MNRLKMMICGIAALLVAAIIVVIVLLVIYERRIEVMLPLLVVV
jgi:hypothetical protein